MEQWVRYVRALEEQADFVGSDRPAGMLALFLSKIPALHSIEIGEWALRGNCYRMGWSGKALEASTGQSLSPVKLEGGLKLRGSPDLDERQMPLKYEPPEAFSALAWTFSKMLTSLAITRRRIQRLSAVLWGRPISGNRLQGVIVNDLQPLHRNTSMCRALSSALADLKDLRLSLEYRMSDEEGEESYRASGPESWLQRFLMLTPRLERLVNYLDGCTFADIDFALAHLPPSQPLANKHIYST